MNVIFLDFDGVINTLQIDTKPFGVNCRSQIERDGFYYLMCNESDGIVSNRQAVMWLNKLCKDIDAKIVVSSTWRMGKKGLDTLRNILYNSGLIEDIEIIGATPVVYDPLYHRGKEIDEYLKEHKEIKNYIILDDDADMLPEQMFLLVKCDTYAGFTEREYIKALDIVDKYFIK